MIRARRGLLDTRERQVLQGPKGRPDRQGSSVILETKATPDHLAIQDSRDPQDNLEMPATKVNSVSLVLQALLVRLDRAGQVAIRAKGAQQDTPAIPELLEFKVSGNIKMVLPIMSEKFVSKRQQ